MRNHRLTHSQVERPHSRCSRRAARGRLGFEIFEPSDIRIVVAGGETQGAWKLMSGSLRATVSIDAWR
jgi:hypothetical protein